MEFTNNVGGNVGDEFILKITQLTQDVSDIKNMFQEFIQISKNNASPSPSTCSCHCNIDVKNKILRQNNSANTANSPNNLGAFKKTNDAEFIIKSSTDVSISFTDYLTNMDINQDHLLHIFNIDSYEDGFIELLQMYITPENLHYCPLRSFEDKRGKLFYVFDKDPDDNEQNVWTVISSTNLASKLRIVQQKIMAQFCVWQNDNIHSLKSHSSQENYRIQISKLTSGVVDKVIQSNSTFRKKLFQLVNC
jgi:hypothetical protein